MFQYSGPGSQSVANRWNGQRDYWHQLLVQKGYLVACVDGRGTGFKGTDFKKMTYKELTKYETEDQIAAAKALGALPYIDESRIGIWGWSYGGHMSTNCILKGNDVFAMAIAVAPVTNWRFYDTIYTERFMRTPQENPTGYDDNSFELCSSSQREVPLDSRFWRRQCTCAKQHAHGRGLGASQQTI